MNMLVNIEEKAVVKTQTVNLDNELKKLEIDTKRMEFLSKMSSTIFKSGLAPNHFRNAESIFVAMEFGITTFGMSPMSSVQNIQVIQGKPGPSAAAAVGACLPLLDKPPRYRYWDQSDKELEKGDSKSFKVTCTMIRGGEVFEGVFSLDDAKTAGLVKPGGGWSKYPVKMLEARAGMFAARLSCQDKMAGVYSAEEIRDFSGREPKDITPLQSQSKTVKLTEKMAEPEPEAFTPPEIKKETDPEIQVKLLNTAISSLNRAFASNENEELTDAVLEGIENINAPEYQEALEKFCIENPGNFKLMVDHSKEHNEHWKRTLDDDSWKKLNQHKTMLKKFFTDEAVEAALAA